MGVGDDTKLIGFCGRFRRQKNPLFLLEIFAEYASMEADTKLMLAGIGELERQMHEKAEELGITDKVMFLGARTDMPDLYQAMDLFLLPSLFEGFGIVYAEAQCAGVPCLATKDAVPAVAKVTDLLKFVPLQEPARQWAEECRHLLSDGKKRQDYSTTVKNNGFDIHDVAAELQRFYLGHTK